MAVCKSYLAYRGVNKRKAANPLLMSHFKRVKVRGQKDPLARMRATCMEIQEATGEAMVDAELVVDGVVNVTLSNGDIYTVFESGNYQKCS